MNYGLACQTQVPYAGPACLCRFDAAHLASDFGAGKATAKQKAETHAEKARALLKKNKQPSPELSMFLSSNNCRSAKQHDRVRKKLQFGRQDMASSVVPD
jgi:hypothetical protein